MRRSLIAIAVLSALLVGSEGRAGMIGIYFNGSTVAIDDATGLFSPLGATGFSSTNSLAATAAGALFSATDLLAPSSNTLLTIDPLTGAGTAVATLDFGGALTDVRSMAIRPGDDALFAISAGGTIFTFDSNLYRVDTSTGIGTLVADLGTFGLQGLDFSPAGVLYGWSVFLGLVTIDVSSGVVNDVNSLVAGDLLQSIAFSPSGALFGASLNQLYTIDPASGVHTPFGPGGFEGLRGIEFVPAVPEPAALTLVGLGLAAAAVGNRRGKRRG